MNFYSMATWIKFSNKLLNTMIGGVLLLTGLLSERQEQVDWEVASRLN